MDSNQFEQTFRANLEKAATEILKAVQEVLLRRLEGFPFSRTG